MLLFVRDGIEPTSPAPLLGSATRTRTWNLSVNSRLLYQLSYHGTTSIAVEVETIEEATATRARATTGGVTSGTTSPTNQTIRQVNQQANAEKLQHHYTSCLWKLAPRPGIEPGTYRLTAGGSAAELPRNGTNWILIAFQSPLLKISWLLKVSKTCKNWRLQRGSNP